MFCKVFHLHTNYCQQLITITFPVQTTKYKILENV